MPRFAANLSMLYPELPFLDRFEAAAKDGFKAVEYLFPYAVPAVELAARLKAHGLQQVLFNAPPGGIDRAVDRRRLGRGHAWHRLHRGPRIRIWRRCGAGPAIRRGAGLPAHPRHGRADPGRHGARRRATHLRGQPALGRGRGRQARPRRADRAHQPARHPALLPEPARPRARDRGRGGRAQPQGADGPVPLPDRRRRRGHEDPQIPAHGGRRPLPDRRACPSGTSPTWAKCTTPTCST